MERQTFSREFMTLAAQSVREPGVSVAQAARHLDARKDLLRKLLKRLTNDRRDALPGDGILKAAEVEIA